MEDVDVRAGPLQPPVILASYIPLDGQINVKSAVSFPGLFLECEALFNAHISLLVDTASARRLVGKVRIRDGKPGSILLDANPIAVREGVEDYGSSSGGARGQAGHRGKGLVELVKTRHVRNARTRAVVAAAGKQHGGKRAEGDGVT